MKLLATSDLLYVLDLSRLVRGYSWFKGSAGYFCYPCPLHYWRQLHFIIKGWAGNHMSRGQAPSTGLNCEKARCSLEL